MFIKTSGLRRGHLFWTPNRRFEVDFVDCPVARRLDVVVHLHRLHDYQGIAYLYKIALFLSFGRPPTINGDKPNTYHGYFKNTYGDHFIFTFNTETQKA